MKWPIILLLCCSCAKIQYVSKGMVPVDFGRQSGNKEKFFFKRKTRFLFFGTMPEAQIIPLDVIAREEGVSSLSKLVIHEYSSWDDLLLTILSLGIYYQKTITISGYGKL